MRSQGRFGLVAALAVVLAGCGDDAPPEEPVTADLAGLTATVYPEPARIVIAAGDTILFDGLPGGVAGDSAGDPPHLAAAFRRADATYVMQSGSFKIEEVIASTEAWRGVARFAGVALDEDGGDAIRFALVGADGEELGLGVVAAGAADGEVTISIEGVASVDTRSDSRASIAFGCDAGEHFLGLGGQAYDVDHRGQTVPLWVEEDGISKVDTDDYPALWFLTGRRHSTHTPMPMFVSSRGYALVLDTPVRSVFAMCSEADDVVRIEAWEPRMTLHLFHGPTPLEAIEKMTAWVGRPEVPPLFAFAPWLDAIFGQENVARVAAALRDAGIATSVIWTEDWRGGNDEGLGYTLEEDWEVDRDLYPDFEDLADTLHADGFKFLIYHNTFLDTEVPAHAEAVAGGHTIRDANGDPYLFQGVKFSDTTLLDLSSPAAVAWGKQKYQDSLDLGADGWMADFAEWLPTDAVLASGEDAIAAHNLYPVEWARLNHDLLAAATAADGVERLAFMRSAYLRSQPLVSVLWAGDQQTDFSAGDGLPSVIPMGIGLGVTGFPYFAHDIAGYMSELTVPTSRELWFRWVTFGALSPVMRTHHGRSARENWSWESDAESTLHLRRWSRLHMQLVPYLHAMASEAAARGTPLFRPLALRWPDFEPGWTSTDQYMLGDRIIVAPVIVEGATGRSVALPAGTFQPLLGGAQVESDGATAIDVDAALEDIPAFVPAGTVLALLPDGVDTVVAVADTSSAQTLADVGDDREVWLYPGGASRFVETGDELGYDWDAAQLHGPPTAATWNGEPLVLTWDPDGAYVPIDVTGPGVLVLQGNTGEATLEITGGAADRALALRLYLP